MEKDPLEKFMDGVEKDYEKLCKIFEHCQIVFDEDEIRIVCDDKIIKTYKNPY